MEIFNFYFGMIYIYKERTWSVNIAINILNYNF